VKQGKKEKSELLDTSYGKFEIRFIWKFAGPFMVLLGIALLFRVPDFLFSADEKITGFILLVIGLFIVYITYYKKRRLHSV